MILTNEEIENIIRKCDHLRLDSHAEVVREAAKKVVEWVEEHKNTGYSSESCFHITDKDWQALQEEVK